MPRRSNEFELTIAYSVAENGWTTASVPALPGTISAGSTRGEARENVLDALQMVLATPSSEALEQANEVERLRVRLELTQDVGRSIDR